LEEGFAFSQALIHQRIASSGLRDSGIKKFYTLAYALLVKYEQRVITFPEGYSIGQLLIKTCAQRIFHIPQGHFTLHTPQGVFHCGRAPHDSHTQKNVP